MPSRPVLLVPSCPGRIPRCAVPAAPAAVNNVAAANATTYGNYSDSDSEEVFVSDVTLFANENANVIANTVSNAAANATTTSQNASTDDIAGALQSWWVVFQLAVLEILRVISPLFA